MEKTVRPDSVRAAREGDEDQIFGLLMKLYDENAPFKPNYRKIWEMIEMGTRDKNVILGIVEHEGKIVGTVGALFAQWWHTDDWHIDEMWNFVHPEYRRSKYAQDLIDYMKWLAEQMGMSLHMGIVTATKMEQKIRLYRRRMLPVGALFVHNLQAAGGPLADNAARGELNG